MRTSETINELAAALAAAQGEMSNAAFDATNPHFKSKYATLAAIRDATVPHLSKHGLSLAQTTDLNTTEMLLTTRLMHASGQWIESVYPIPVSDKPHVMGSALTYAKRYSWAAIAGVASEEDDDGNDAQQGAKNGQPAAPVKRTRQEISDDANRKRQELRDVEADVLQIGSLPELDRYVRTVMTPEFMAGLGMKQYAAEEYVARRRLELTNEAPKELDEDLREDGTELSPDQTAKLRDEMIEAIQKTHTEADLLVWRESPAFRRDLASLPQPMQLAVRRAGALKIETLQRLAAGAHVP